MDQYGKRVCGGMCHSVTFKWDHSLVGYDRIRQGYSEEWGRSFINIVQLFVHVARTANGEVRLMAQFTFMF